MKPTPMTAFRTITTARVHPTLPRAIFTPPTLTPAQFAAQENAAMRKACGLYQVTPDMRDDALARARVDRFMAIRDQMAFAPMNTTEIADAWGLQQGGISRQLQRMQDDGMIRRIMATGCAQYELTPAAKALWAKEKGAK